MNRGAPTGPHFFVAPQDVDGGRAVLSGADARHLVTVLRARPGTLVSLADGTGALYQACVRDRGEQVELTVEWSTDARRNVPLLTVVHALPKGRKLDEVVQRLSEIGVERIIPVHSQRSEVQLAGDRAERAATRWRAVALAAAKQSRRARVLEVSPVGQWGTSFPPGSTGVVLWEEAETPLRDVLPLGVDTLVLGIGPEGGLTKEEVDLTGLPTASLGPTILRTETAALVASAAVLTLMGRLG